MYAWTSGNKGITRTVSAPVSSAWLKPVRLANWAVVFANIWRSVKVPRHVEAVLEAAKHLP